MKHTILFFYLVLSINSFSQEQVIDQRTGITIIFSAEGKIFPERWYSERVNAQGLSLDKNEYERSEKIIIQALDKYPKSVVADNLKTIYVLKELRFFGTNYGGTYSSDNIYVVNDETDSFYIEKVFHAELSSILMKKYKSNFNESEWLKLNPEKFSYGKGGTAAIKNNSSSLKSKSKLNKQGFIYEYAMASIEEDFNAFAGLVFAPTKEFKSAVEKYMAIREKRLLTIQFYSKLDSSLSVEYFDKLLNTTTYKKH
ncbi:hypothetical protein H7U19_16655 [Hyunsoonleella sp. SJ7]|uniref:Uncharacterized protein n=1 Tax=Hyunsoonleella aquatilis TaxID=2762758 RepID=A0A923KND6_9FLAO|nr:hypothetical protein [Hyunsoonleella aquatilis]MBC3760040.1 hypothetical protein [Hyunsoonleella aquatilis]